MHPYTPFLSIVLRRKPACNSRAVLHAYFIRVLRHCTPSDLQHVAIARHHLVKHRVHKKSEEQPRHEPRNYDNREGLLRVRADTGGKRGRQKAQAGDERRHHDRSQAQQRSFAGGGANIFIFESQLVDIRNQDHSRFHRNAHQRQQPEYGRNAEGRVREFQRDQRAHRFGHYHSERDCHREFEIAVQREQDEKNQKHRQRPHYLELLLRFEEFGVFAAPVDAIAGWKGFCDVRDGPLSVTHSAFEIASLDAVLHANVAGIVFAIDKGIAGSFLNVRERRERNLLPAGRAYQQIGDLLRVLSELRLHAHYEIEELLALNHLRRCLAAHRRLNHAFHVRHIYAVTRDLLPIHLDQETRLAEFAYHGEFRESGDLR